MWGPNEENWRDAGTWKGVGTLSVLTESKSKGSKRYILRCILFPKGQRVEK